MYFIWDIFDCTEPSCTYMKYALRMNLASWFKYIITVPYFQWYGYILLWTVSHNTGFRGMYTICWECKIFWLPYVILNCASKPCHIDHQVYIVFRSLRITSHHIIAYHITSHHITSHHSYITAILIGIHILF